MRTLILFLLPLLALASQSATPGVSNTAQQVGAAPVDRTPDYYFYWSMESDNADYGATAPVSQVAAIYDFSASLVANPWDSNNLWLFCPNGFSKADWWNYTNSPKWGYTLGKGWMQTRWMYDSSFVASTLIFQLAAKSTAVPIYDANDGTRLDTATVGGSPGIKSGSVEVAFPGTVAAGDELTLSYYWNRKTTNPNSSMIQRIYVQRDGYATVSAYNTTALAAQPEGYVWHDMQPGNDITTANDSWLKDFYIGGQWVHDLPVLVWQDFNFATLSQANCEASDHNNTLTWAVTGAGIASLATSTSAHKTSPSTINLYTDSGTYGLRNDLTGTGARSVGVIATDSSAIRAFGMWVRVVQGLSSGSTAHVAYATDTGNSASFTVAVQARNNGGQHELRLVNSDAAVSSSVNISADTWYYVAWTAHRSNTSTIWVYSEAGTQLGTATVTGSNRSVGSGRIGSPSTYTAQSAGSYIDVSNFVFSSNATAQLIPWEVQ